MNKRVVEKSDVAAAMARLEEQGINASADAILAELGRGSKKTILDLRREVEADRDAEQQTSEQRANVKLINRYPMPEAMAHRITVAQNSISELALAFAGTVAEERARVGSAHQDTIAAIKRRHDKDMAALKAHLRELEKASEEQSEEIQIFKEANAELMRQLKSSANRLDKAEAQNAKLTDRLLAGLGDQTAPENSSPKEGGTRPPTKLQVDANRQKARKAKKPK